MKSDLDQARAHLRAASRELFLARQILQREQCDAANHALSHVFPWLATTRRETYLAHENP